MLNNKTRYVKRLEENTIKRLEEQD